MTKKNLPKSGKVKNALLGFLCKHFGRKGVFGFGDVVRAGWIGSKNIRLAKLARDGYLKPMGKKRYRYIRGVKATNGQVVRRLGHGTRKMKEVTPRVPLTPVALMADHAVKDGLIAYSKSDILIAMDMVDKKIKELTVIKEELDRTYKVLIGVLPNILELLVKTKKALGE